MKKVLSIALGAVMVLSVFAVPASAGDRDVVRAGDCSARSDWKLKVKADDGGLEVEFEVDQNVVGDTWKVRVLQDGERIFAGRRTTRGASGSFTVERMTSNNAGTDNFIARARNASTDEVCRGTLAF
jgi:hypothetical protein